jgi:hypothetical protein
MGISASSPQTTTFSICTREEARALLSTANAYDMYVVKCDTHEMNYISRRHNDYTPMKITDYDLLKYRQRIEAIFASEEKMKLFANIGKHVYFIFMMPSADNAMPHTRPETIICLPHVMQIDADVIVHEMCHVHQRIFDKKWRHFFENKWDWKEWRGVLPEKLEKHRRINPDTVDCPLWIFKNKWIPVPVFNNITKPFLRDCSIWFYNLKSGIYSKEIPDDFLEFRMANVPLWAYEHPREMSAYMIQNYDEFTDIFNKNKNNGRQSFSYSDLTPPVQSLVKFMSSFVK